jgi:hypothetical protein
VKGNYIGTNVPGTAAIPNDERGVWIGNGAPNNIIGGSNATPGGNCSGDCNLISGNGKQGIELYAADTYSNTISGNYIGVNVSGTAAISNNEGGVFLVVGPRYNTIGGATAAEGNLISGNGSFGVALEHPDTMSNTVQGNIIGLDVGGSDLGNSGNGVMLRFNTTGNQIKENVIAYSKYVEDEYIGCGIYGPSVGGNPYNRNSIYENDDKGICSGDWPNRPVIMTATSYMVTGTTLANGQVEIYSDNGSQGKYYHATVTASPGGSFSYSQAQPFTGTNVTVIVTSNGGSTSEFAYKLPGSGVFEATGQQDIDAASEENTQDCAIGDVDVDGDQDVICANSSPAYVYLNDGNGRFTAAANGLGDDPGQAVELGLVNDDEYLDVVIATAAGFSTNVYLNNGSGFFVLDGGHQFPADNGQSLAMKDLDGDEWADVVVGTATGKDIWLNDGSGKFLDDQNHKISLTGPLTDTQGIAIGDLNQDGRDDLVVAHGSNQGTEFWLNDGGGTLSFSLDRTEGSDDSRAVAIGYLDDIEGEPGAYPDVLVANGSGQPDIIYFNVGGGTFMSRTLDITNSNGVAIGRFDGDDYADVIIASDSDQPNYILLNNDQDPGTFSKRIIPCNSNNDSQNVAVGDLDNDGDLDVFVANGNNGDGEAADNERNQVLKNLNELKNRVGVKGGTLNFTQGMWMELKVPPGALSQTTIFQYDGQGAQDETEPGLGDFHFAGRSFTLEREDESSEFNGKLVTVTLEYDPAERQPKLFFYDDEADEWADIAEDCGTGYTYGNGWLRVAICHLTKFGIFAQNSVQYYLPAILKDQ